MGLCAACFLSQSMDIERSITVTYTVPEDANHIKHEDGNDEHASSIVEWALNRGRKKMRCVCAPCVCVLCMCVRYYVYVKACH